MVIVDEFHHAEAATYRRLLEHVRPQVLLGLTATPERADGGDVTEWFGGHIATELRLWHALEQDLLCPFHYFGIADETDLTRHRLARAARYDVAGLSNLYTGNDARAADRAALAAATSSPTWSDAGPGLLRVHRPRPLHGPGVQRGGHP